MVGLAFRRDDALRSAQEGVRMSEEEKKTSIQVTPKTRDRLYKLKFRKTYDQFLNELSDLYESSQLKGL
jgi:hypothetical protein